VNNVTTSHSEHDFDIVFREGGMAQKYGLNRPHREFVLDRAQVAAARVRMHIRDRLGSDAASLGRW
jgi:hypothetical protein